MQDVVTKKLKIIKLFTLEEGNDFVNEVENNARLPDKSQYLVKMEGFLGYDCEKVPFGFSDEEIIYDYAFIVIPHIKGVSLIEYLIHKADTKSEVSLENTRCLLYHIVEALYELEEKTGLSHMDLKPDNIMISKKGEVKVIDFCHAFPSTELTKRSYGTEEYAAPEIFHVRGNPEIGYLPR